MKKLFSYTLVSTFSLILFIPFASAVFYDGYWMMWWNYWWFGIGSIFMILIWWLIIFLLFLAINNFYDKKNMKNNSKNEETPLDILKKRLAKWEIKEEEFDKLKNKLK